MTEWQKIKTPFKIDKNIPAPLTSRAGLTDLLPLKSMEVGDSFLIPGPGAVKHSGTVYACAKRLAIKLRTRSELGGALRVWRIE